MTQRMRHQGRNTALEMPAGAAGHRENAENSSRQARREETHRGTGRGREAVPSRVNLRTKLVPWMDPRELHQQAAETEESKEMTTVTTVVVLVLVMVVLV